MKILMQKKNKKKQNEIKNIIKIIHSNFYYFEVANFYTRNIPNHSMLRNIFENRNNALER